jgi:alkylated DNA nucleotide flippase Atl1
MKPLEISKRERSMRRRGKGDNPAQVGRTLKVQEEETHILPGYRVVGTGLGTPTDENPKPLADMEEGKSMKGREVKGEGGRVLVCDVLKV